MPPAPDQIDLETLLREAISSVAITAHARGIAISAHIDNRLPSRVQCDAEALSGFLRRGLARMIEAGRTEKVALALWHGEENGEAPIMLEACRAVEDGETPVTGLADLWTLPIDGANARPFAARQSDGAETVLVALPCAAVEDAPPMAWKWGESFRGRHTLVVRDILFDRERCAASLANLGSEVTFTRSAERAMEIAQAGAEAGRPPDFLVLDSDLLGDGAASLARRFRADPALAGARILLAGNWHSTDQPGDDAELFDAVLRSPMPWRRLMEVLHDLVRQPTTSSPATTLAPPPAENRAAGDIPALTGRRILIAEDVATNQVLLEAVLAPTGAAVETVTDGAAVLARQAEAPADLILMDLQMPGMGGIAAMRRLRALGGAAGAVKVVALTAYARGADRKMALDSGMDAYLAKPIVVSEFYDLLRQLLPEGGNGTG
jgi:CheY-like chemotaxis protein